MTGPTRGISRRRALQLLGGGGVAALAGCSAVANPLGTGNNGGSGVEPREPPSGPPDETFELTAAPDTTADSSGYTYNGSAPGPVLRASEGDVVRVTLDNQLPAESTVHWHGLPVANSMDGVPDLTQAPVASNDSFEYTFRAEPAGTYFYHSHAGLQLDRGLFGPLLIEPSEPHVEFDAEYVVVLDDYLTEEPNPPERGSTVDSGGMMGGGMGGMMSQYRPPYAGMTMNGRLPQAAPTFPVQEGQRVRFRFINASSATPFRVRAAGHPFEITHADGQPVEPVTVDSFAFSPGERYDAVVSADSPGRWQLSARALRGRGLRAVGVLEYPGATGSPAAPDTNGNPLRYADLSATRSLGVDGEPDRVFDLTLSPSGDGYGWAINGQTYPDSDPLPIAQGDHVRLRLQNQSPVSHPMHLHGHFFQVGAAVKDTVTVPGHMGTATVDFRADNPGNWFFHCHNLYHLEAGMARVLTYQ